MRATVICGGQFGSEAKGNVTGHLAQEYECHVRVGAANAGHTVYTSWHGELEKHVLQQLPCAAYANPEAVLILGPGAMISPLILQAEINLNEMWRRDRGFGSLRGKLFVDHRAHVVTKEHIRQEQATDLAKSIGSTSTLAREGIGAAQAARVMRTDFSTVAMRERMAFLRMWKDPIKITDTISVMRTFDRVLLEGTQGTDLSNTTGFYPYVTSRNTAAAGIIADAGVAPSDVDRVIMVCRTYPIRVAGRSGPFWPDSVETTWARLGVNEDDERTTVTKRVRRVATFSYDQVAYNARLNGATEIALMFADYVEPTIVEATGDVTSWLEESDTLDYMVRQIEMRTRCKVTLVGTGPATICTRN